MVTRACPASRVLLLLLLLLLLPAAAASTTVSLDPEAGGGRHLPLMSCSAGTISIQSAVYGGALPADKCGPGHDNPVGATRDVRKAVAAACAGRARCDFLACATSSYPGCSALPASQLLGDPCVTTQKGLAVTYSCSSATGWTIVLLLLLGGGSYFGGGYAINRRRKGLRGAAALPHAAFWKQFHGLVMDGVRFTQSGGRLRQQGHYSRLAAAATPGSGGGKAHNAAVKKSERRRSAKASKSKGKHPRRGHARGKDTGEALGAPPVENATHEMADDIAAAEGGAGASTAAQQSTASAAGGGRWVRVPG
jgi:hypothetical protein